MSGNFAKTGYHTVQLPKEVRVADGEKFSVVITYATVDDSACVPLEDKMIRRMDTVIVPQRDRVILISRKMLSGMTIRRYL